MLPSLLSAVRSLYSVIIILYFDSFALIKYWYYCLIKPYEADVYDNLKSIQSNITEKDAAATLKKFYKYYIDIRHEFLLINLLPKRQLLKMSHIENPTVLERYFYEKRNVILMLSHYAANIDMAVLLPLYTKYNIIGSYTPNHNNKLNDKIRNIRLKFGATPIPSRYIYKKALETKTVSPTCYVLFSDQPAFPPYKYYTEFLGQIRYMKIGAEKIAQKTDCVVMTVKATKQRRHHFNYELIVLTEHAAEEPCLYISRTYFSILEKQVQERPELWMHLKNHKPSYKTEYNKPPVINASIPLDKGIRWLISFFLNF